MINALIHPIIPLFPYHIQSNSPGETKKNRNNLCFLHKFHYLVKLILRASKQFLNQHYRVWQLCPIFPWTMGIQRTADLCLLLLNGKIHIQYQFRYPFSAVSLNLVVIRFWMMSQETKLILRICKGPQISLNQATLMPFSLRRLHVFFAEKEPLGWVHQSIWSEIEFCMLLGISSFIASLSFRTFIQLQEQSTDIYLILSLFFCLFFCLFKKKEKKSDEFTLKPTFTSHSIFDKFFSGDLLHNFHEPVLSFFFSILI